MAEAMLRCLYGDVYEAFSAGTRPDRVHPLAMDVLSESGIETSELRSKGVEEMLDHFFDVVVTVCDQARETCPIYPGAAEVLHHSFTDPSSLDGTMEERLEGFRLLRDEIREWVEATFGPGSPRYLVPPSEFS
jgi:arsenate reductase